MRIPWLIPPHPGRALALAAALLAGACEHLPKYGETSDTSDSSDTGDTGDTEGGAPEVCRSYVDCLKEVDAEAGAEAEARYGAAGSCWTDEEAARAQCLALCDSQLRTYSASFPEIAACDASGIVTDVEFEIGEAVFDPADPFLPPVYRPMTQGDTLKIVRGGQGLLMLPLGLRGRNFEITEDPNDWDNPKMPKVNLWVDIEGFNTGFGGHFARLANYSVGFVPIDDEGTLEHMYIAVIIPDTIADPTELTSRPGKVAIELRTYNEPAAVRELEFVVAPEIQEY